MKPIDKQMLFDFFQTKRILLSQTIHDLNFIINLTNIHINWIPKIKTIQFVLSKKQKSKKIMSLKQNYDVRTKIGSKQELKFLQQSVVLTMKINQQIERVLPRFIGAEKFSNATDQFITEEIQQNPWLKQSQKQHIATYLKQILLQRKLNLKDYCIRIIEQLNQVAELKK